MTSPTTRNFSEPQQVLEFPLGRGEVLVLDDASVLRMTLQPGWRWSQHLKPSIGMPLCQAPHFQHMVSGRVAGVMADGTEFEFGPGDVSILPPGHDLWVVGDEPAVIVDWGGAHIWGRSLEEVARFIVI
nr:cupin domain-containing protein [Propionibacterium sp.]